MVKYYQIVGDTFKFIYKTSSGRYKTASGTNFSGMQDFLIYSGAERLPSDMNIYEKCSSLNTIQSIVEKF
jgi:hypothetical protein